MTDVESAASKIDSMEQSFPGQHDDDAPMLVVGESLEPSGDSQETHTGTQKTINRRSTGDPIRVTEDRRRLPGDPQEIS